jgi:hypothetical protein
MATSLPGKTTIGFFSATNPIPPRHYKDRNIVLDFTLWMSGFKNSSGKSPALSWWQYPHWRSSLTLSLSLQLVGLVLSTTYSGGETFELVRFVTHLP